MASRSKTDLKREAMKTTLRHRYAAGGWPAQRPLPGLRELSLEFGLSKDVAALALRELVEEGLLYTLPRVGTFVRETRARRSEMFVLITHIAPALPYDNASLKRGFEDAVVGVGATPLVMPGEAFESAFKNGDLEQLAGVFDMATETNGAPFWKLRFPQSDLACVRIGDDSHFAPGYDLISFDNVDGGARAAAHLIELGHRKIAFLGIHEEAAPHPLSLWSRQREQGWRVTMENAGLETHDLAFHPTRLPEDWPLEYMADAEEILGSQIWLQIKERTDITAFVAANDHLALAVMRHLETVWPASLWPAVIGFDREASGDDHLLSSLRLPWDELGRAAGETLWARYQRQLPAAPQMRRVPMKLIPRLSCLPLHKPRYNHSKLMAMMT